MGAIGKGEIEGDKSEPTGSYSTGRASMFETRDKAARTTRARSEVGIMCKTKLVGIVQIY